MRLFKLSCARAFPPLGLMNDAAGSDGTSPGANSRFDVWLRSGFDVSRRNGCSLELMPAL